LTRRLGLIPDGPFGSFKEVHVGCLATASLGRGELLERLREAVEGEARLIPGGPEEVSRIGVLTGSGASALTEAAEMGLDTLVTGEVPHHVYHQAMELGLNVLLGGPLRHRDLRGQGRGRAPGPEFSLEWEFLHFPTGL
jgi:putative NIF3 family GTP cyclohydrolase 1 type 2